MSAAPVDEEPEVALTKWAIIRAVDSGHYHFIGMKSSGIGQVLQPDSRFQFVDNDGADAKRTDLPSSRGP